MSILSYIWLLPSKLPPSKSKFVTEEEDSNMGQKNVDISSGFHVIEIHAPTVGYGVFLLILCLLSFFLLWRLYKCLRARVRSQRPFELPMNVHPRQFHAMYPPMLPPVLAYGNSDVNPRFQDVNEESSDSRPREGGSGLRRGTVLGNI